MSPVSHQGPMDPANPGPSNRPSAPNPSQRVSIQEHLRLVTSLCTAPSTVTLPLAKCLGLTTSEPVTARLEVPPFTNSAMDGFAVRFRDVSTATPGSPVTLPVIDDVPAGSPADQPLRPGTAQRIMTGARVPEGADTVVKVEDTNHAPGLRTAPRSVTIMQAPRAGANIRHRGEALTVDDPVLPAGTILTAEALSAAAAAGHGQLPVHPTPRVGILTTGSELCDAGDELLRGRIPDSNGILLAGLVHSAGGIVTEQLRVPDDPIRLRQIVSSWQVDLIITAGGISMGAYEVVRQGLPELTFHPVAQQPGGPQGAGWICSTPVVALPGNPVGVYTSFHVYVVPLLVRLRGLPSDAVCDGPGGARTSIDPVLQRPVAHACAATAWTSPRAKTQFMPVRWSPEGVAPVHPLGSKSHLVTSLPLVEGLAMVGPGIEHVSAGDELAILMTRRNCA